MGKRPATWPRPTPAGPRFPLAPLLEAAGTDALTTLAARCDVGRRQLNNWQRHGLGVDTADRAATAVGLHPSTIWPDWWAVTVDA